MLRPHRTVDRDLATYFRDPRVRLAFSFQSKYLGMSPFRCPSLFTILSFMEYEYGVYPSARRLRRGDGGDGAGRRATSARGSGSASRSSEILFEGRRAVGVRTAAGDATATTRWWSTPISRRR